MGKSQNERAVIDLVINGQQAATSLKEVSLAVSKTRSEFNKLKEVDNPELYAAKLAELQKLTAAQKAMTARINDTATAWQRFKSNAAEVATGVLGGNVMTAGLQALVGLIPEVLAKTTELKDQFADIAKATDMSDTEVKQLDETLRNLNTRTATKDLREMAAVGGQFGIAKKDIADFVASADQINVALGDEFGSAEETAKAVLTMRNVFLDVKSDDVGKDMLHIGNAMNVLSAAGAATAPVIQDFSSRMGGTLIPLGMSSSKILGLSATLQELNVTAERGSTAVVNIFQKMLTETETFAKVAGVPLKEYKKLIGEDINAAFLKYVEGLKKTTGNQVEFMAVLEKSKLTGAGEMEVLSKLTSNTDMFAEKTKLAGEAMEGTDSIMNEFNQRNYQLAVNLKKLGEFFSNLLTMDWLSNFAEGLTSAAVALLSLNNEAADATKKFETQRSAVQSLEKTYTPLIDRIIELKDKSGKSKEEQAELKTAIEKVAGAIPESVTQFDKYGKAMDVSTGAARDYIESQKELLKFQNADAIKKQTEELTKQQQQLAEGLAKRSTGRVSDRDPTSFGGGYKMRDMTHEELIELDKQNAQLRDAVNKKKLLLQALTGEYKPEKKNDTTKKDDGKKDDGKGGGNIDLGESKEEKAARKKREKEGKATERDKEEAKRNAAELDRLITDAQERTAQKEGDIYRKEQLAFGEKYQRMFELAGTNKDKMAEITTVMYDELDALQQKEDQRQHDKEEKRMEELRKNAEQELEIKKAMALADIALDVANGTITKEEGKAGELLIEQQFLEAKRLLYSAHYAALGDMSNLSAKEQAEIAAKKAADLTKLEVAITQNVADQTAAKAAIVNAETEHDKEGAEQRKRIAKMEFQEKKDIFDASVSVLKGFFKQNTVIYRAAMIAQQAWALGEVAIQYSRAVMGSIAGAAGIPFPGNLLAIAKSLALPTLQSAAAVARIRSQKFDMPAFADGGFTSSTNPSGFTSGPTVYANRFLAGEAGQEFIINNQALQNPVVANFARIMDAVQKTGNFSLLSQGFAAGSAASGGAQAVSNNSSMAISNNSFVGSGPSSDSMAVVAAIGQLHTKIEDLANRPIVNNYRLFEQFQDRVQEIQQRVSL